MSWKLLADVEPEAVEWLWPGRVPLGKVTVLAGEPGVGKTLCAIDLAARVTTSRAMPLAEHGGEPAGVVFVTTEDGLADTIRPRFDAAGGDTSRIVVCDFEDVPTIGTAGGLDDLRAMIRDVSASLVVLDPLVSLLDDRVESYSNHEMRRALAPLAALATEEHVAVIGVAHLTKGGSSSAKARVNGSLALVALARSVLLCAPHPEVPERFLCASVKANLAPPMPALAYTIEPHGLAIRVAWGGETGHSADALLAAAIAEERPAKLDQATDFLRGELAQGPRQAEDIAQAAERQGIAPRTLRRASERLGVLRKRPVHRGPWWWTLPPALDGQPHISTDGQVSDESKKGPENGASPLDGQAHISSVGHLSDEPVLL